MSEVKMARRFACATFGCDPEKGTTASACASMHVAAAAKSRCMSP